MKKFRFLLVALFAIAAQAVLAQNATNFKIVDTHQAKCFDDVSEIAAPAKGSPFYGQDAQHIGNEASYTDNGDGTVTDNVTGLIWQKGYQVMSYDEAVEAVKKFDLAGYDDWRIPSIKEAYSLIMFSGADVNPELSKGSDMPGTPFINTDFFDFVYASNGNRPIDTQMMTTALYVGSTDREKLLFGVNFADGRIKGYGMQMGGQGKQFTVRFVRGATYGENSFVDNSNGTISDVATSLMWSKEDSKAAMNWQEALEYAQQMNKEKYLGFDDWRVPNAKELQSIVDYTRSPLSSSSASIDPLFAVTPIVDESGANDFPFYWTSTTHENSGTSQGSAGIYVSFGRSLGNMSNMEGVGMMMPGQGQGQGQRPEGERQMGEGMQGERGQRQMGEGERPPMMEGQQQNNGEKAAPNWIDVHGAGCQRSDPKSGDASIYAEGHGPQGDVVRIYNYVRLVRDI
ncbi:MAG: DUF1566 domain-containing protein [Rikenellaceae bacterium]